MSESGYSHSNFNMNNMKHNTKVIYASNTKLVRSQNSRQKNPSVLKELPKMIQEKDMKYLSAKKQNQSVFQTISPIVKTKMKIVRNHNCTKVKNSNVNNCRKYSIAGNVYFGGSDLP